MQICIRHFQWDRDAADYAARIFIVTESIKFVVFALVLGEIFFIFFKSSGLAQLLLVEVFFGLEIIALLAGFTVVRMRRSPPTSRPARSNTRCSLPHAFCS